MRLVPVTLREANAYVAAHHRHSEQVRGCLFCVGAEVEDAPCECGNGWRTVFAGNIAVANGPCLECGGSGRRGRIVGVAIVGRPLARALQDG